jgi:hypothetical protein
MRLAITACVLFGSIAVIAVELIRAGHWIAGMIFGLLLLGGTEWQWSSKS